MMYTQEKFYEKLIEEKRSDGFSNKRCQGTWKNYRC